MTGSMFKEIIEKVCVKYTQVYGYSTQRPLNYHGVIGKEE
jgi:hypothetical protein